MAPAVQRLTAGAPMLAKKPAQDSERSHQPSGNAWRFAQSTNEVHSYQHLARERQAIGCELSDSRSGEGYVTLIGQWRYSLHTDKVNEALQIAERAYALAQQQNDAAVMIGAHRALASTLYYLGDFQSVRLPLAVRAWPKRSP